MSEGRVIGIAWRDRPRAPMIEAEAAAVTVAAGVEGDYHGRSRVRDRLVTVLAVEGWQAACAELGATLPWTYRRANLLVEGLGLAGQIGARLVAGPLVLEIVEETEPCARMDAQHQGLTAALVPDWRGGVTCRVLSDGALRVGDPIRLEPAGGGG